MRRRARLKDIADQTGFSTNTVSLALHGSPLVAEETSKAIWAVARQLKYRPNHLARSLVSRQSKTVGLILTNIQNPILTRAAQAIQNVLAEHRYVALFAVSNHSMEEEKDALELFMTRQVDGILIYPNNPSEWAHIGEIVAQGTPVVMLSGGAGAGVETVGFDACAGARMATEHLIGLGHRRIALIDNSAALGNPEKLTGYIQAMEAAGLPLDSSLLLDPQGFDAGHGYEGMAQLMTLPSPPSAVLAANDMLAMGALHWCRSNGIDVPEDVSIVGFDNIELAAYSAPPLTTIQYGADELSRRAVERLLRLIEDDDDEEAVPRVELVDPRLVVRLSTGRPKG